MGIRDKFDLVFFAPMPKPGIRMGEKAVTTMDKMFRSLGIRSYTGKKIVEFTEGSVTLEDGTRIEADLFMFIAAGDGHGVIKASDLPFNESGFVVTNPAREVPEHIAEIMARAAVKDIARKISGRGKPVSYVEDVCILCVMDMGNGAGFIYGDDKRALFIPLPIVGHWLKKGWGRYCEWRKFGKVPRLPGM